MFGIIYLAPKLFPSQNNIEILLWDQSSEVTLFVCSNPAQEKSVSPLLIQTILDAFVHVYNALSCGTRDVRLICGPRSGRR